MSYGVNSYGVNSYGDTETSQALPTVTADNASTYSVRTTVTADTSTSYTLLSAVSVSASISCTYSIRNFDYRIVPTGDSNASGRGSFNQANSASNAYLYNNSGNVVILADPYDGGASQVYAALDDGVSPGGSYVQHLADLLDAAGKSVMFIPANRGGTQSSDWTTTTAGTKYEALKNRVNAAGGDGSDLVFLIHLGANDANSSVPQATFKSRVETFIGNLNADFPLAKKYLQKVHYFSGAPVGSVDAIRAGVDDVWNGATGCLRGADLDGITTNIHYGNTGVPGTCTSELNEVALRTFNAIRNVQTDSSVTYNLKGSASSDSVSEYSIREVTNADISPSWLIRNSVSTDIAALFNLRGAVQIDGSENYLIRANAQGDSASSYQIQTATSVTADSTVAYTVINESSVVSDNASTYRLTTSAIADSSVTFTLRGSVSSSSTPTYDVMEAATASLVTNYIVHQHVISDSLLTYFIDGQVPQYQGGIKVKKGGTPVEVVGVYTKTGGEYVPATVLVKSGGEYRLPS